MPTTTVVRRVGERHTECAYYFGYAVFPLFLNLSGKRVVVVGGGAVGTRKIGALHASGAVVRVVDPGNPRHDWHGSPVIHVAEAYRADHLDGAALAFACATPDVNAQVVRDGRVRGVWVNSATAPDSGDFTLPAVVRRGELTLAVSTGGAAPALARCVREKWEAEFDTAFADWVRLLADMRAEVLATIPDEARRRALLDSFASWEWLARLRVEGVDPVREAMRALL